LGRIDLASARKTRSPTPTWRGSARLVFFEIAQKGRLGKWPEVAGVLDGLPALHETQGGRVAPLDAEICLSAGSLPWPHRDPFDRLIAVTALRRQLTLVSADSVFDEVLKRVW
jgi:PIN domain nuclease of toxin-antitoxin system